MLDASGHVLADVHPATPLHLREHIRTGHLAEQLSLPVPRLLAATQQFGYLRRSPFCVAVQCCFLAGLALPFLLDRICQGFVPSAVSQISRCASPFPELKSSPWLTSCFPP